ncbi:MAG: MBL fold metallo-hydrolase [Candidatus Dojkabacteria bacterium]|nr:MBL fold metallo-hydrolase [Candidatus Dojkabacteria bacterium]MDQ7021127.1 MBL fold metallo-hydrolase [Candidatus Dojkabacteria bacterium]
MIEVEFYGAAKTVTGSNYLVKTPEATFIVDCGMFQGPEVEGRNLEPYEYDASKVDFVLLTHAHIDHSGMLPKLYKAGFRGKIYATSNTIQITELLLFDSAKIQESNYQSGNFYGKYTQKVALAYNSSDAEQTIRLLQPVQFDEEFEIMPGIRTKFLHAGHILGAASIEVTIANEGEERQIMFSGDIGRVEQPLIPGFDKDYKSTPDYIFIEALYGGLEHPKRSESIEEMVKIINRTISRGGNAYIPAFSVQRTQEILKFLKDAIEAGDLDKDIPVWLDSPLAQKVSKIYTAALQHNEDSIFYFDSLRFVNRYSQSRGIQKTTGQIVLAGSGMADGGRIMNHLTTGLDKKNNSVIFVGYQAAGTIGRELTDGHKEITIGKTKIHVSADIRYLHGFSSHGDTSDYLQWIKRHKSEKLKKVFLVHAEEDRSKALDLELDQIGIMESYIPDWKEKVTLE